jgi:serine/threonine-protein kinase
MPHLAGEVDPASQTLYLIMNWAPGSTLEEWVARNPGRDFLDAVRLIGRLAAAVDYLHSGAATGGRAILHRDIKPANVIIDEGRVRLVDFGFARALMGQSMTLAGTPAYMPPEVVSGGTYSEASDRFGVGATAYFAITGAVPILDDYPAMRERLAHSMGEDARPDLVDTVMAMMDVDPARRPASTISWAQSLAAAAVSDPTVQVPMPPTTATPTVASDPMAAATEAVPVVRRKRRLGLVALLVVLVLGLGGVAGAIVLNRDDSGSGAGDTAGPEGGGASETTSPDDTTTTTSAALKSMPSLIGSTLSDATARLERAGIEVSTEDVLDEKAVDGTVLEQTPAAGEPVPTKATLKVARQPVSVFLADMKPVEGYVQSGLATMNGTAYTRSVFFDTYDDGDAGWDLGRHYRRLRAVVGLRDDAPSGSKMKLEVFADGRSIFARNIALGETVPIDLDVTGVLRLRLTATDLVDNYQRSAAVFGDAAVLGTADEVQATTTTTTY